MYDCNKITVDGSIDTCCSGDTIGKLRSMAWNVIEVDQGGSHDVGAIISISISISISTLYNSTFAVECQMSPL